MAPRGHTALELCEHATAKPQGQLQSEPQKHMRMLTEVQTCRYIAQRDTMSLGCPAPAQLQARRFTVLMNEHLKQHRATCNKLLWTTGAWADGPLDKLASHEKASGGVHEACRRCKLGGTYGPRPWETFVCAAKAELLLRCSIDFINQTCLDASGVADASEELADPSPDLLAIWPRP